MGAGNAIAVSQVHADPSRNRFFACVQMNEAWDLASRKLNVQPLLKSRIVRMIRQALSSVA